MSLVLRYSWIWVEIQLFCHWHSQGPNAALLEISGDETKQSRFLPVRGVDMPQCRVWKGHQRSFLPPRRDRNSLRYYWKGRGRECCSDLIWGQPKGMPRRGAGSRKCHSRAFQQPWSLCILWIMTKRTFLSSWYISHVLCAHRQNLNATSLPKGVLYWTEPFYFIKIKTSGEKQIALSFSKFIVVHEMKLGQLLALIFGFSDFSISADAARGHSWASPWKYEQQV